MKGGEREHHDRERALMKEDFDESICFSRKYTALELSTRSPLHETIAARRWITCLIRLALVTSTVMKLSASGIDEIPRRVKLDR